MMPELVFIFAAYPDMAPYPVLCSSAGSKHAERVMLIVRILGVREVNTAYTAHVFDVGVEVMIVPVGVDYPA
jgi:hypothetical protein